MTNAPAAFAEPARFVPGKIVKVAFERPPTSAYDIVIGYNILTEAATLIRLRLGTRRCFIVTDSNIEPLYRARVEATMAAGGHDIIGSHAIPAGEGHKNFAQLQPLVEKILTAGADRKSLIVALGGGVVGDMAGLAASLIMRGIDYVQIPTTLLAQVDSSVGGKTAIDSAQGKNNIGTFHQPKLVLIDVTTLDSLPARDMRAGYAEIVKYGLINDASFFRWCVAHGGQLLGGSHEAQITAIHACCLAKAAIVAEDEREAGARALLNLGHTFGHALETSVGFGNLFVHGEAVALGILLAFRLSVKLGLCAGQDYDDIRAHFASVGLPVALPAFAYDTSRLMQLMTQDKKAENGNITLILVRGIGHAFISRDTDPQQIRAVWQEFISP